MKNVRLYLISDSVGETAQKLISAVSRTISYDRSIRYSTVILLQMNDEESLLEILQDALLDKSIVVTTLVNKDLVKFVEAFAKRTGLQHVDFMTPLISVIEATVGLQAVQEPGAIHRFFLNQEYFSRVAAMEFAVKYDDGKDPRGFLDADIVLLGVSRNFQDTVKSIYG